MNKYMISMLGSGKCYAYRKCFPYSFFVEDP